MKELESEDGLGLGAADIKQGQSVVWYYHGTPFDAEILQVYGK